MKSGAIRSILDTDGQKSESYRRGLVPRRKNCPCDLMMGCASADFTDGTARTSIIRHSLMPMLPSESSICHTNLGTTIHSCMFHMLEWLLINACNNEDYAKIWTRCHLNTLYFASSSSFVSFTQLFPTCGRMPLPALSLWPGRQPCRPRLVDGRRRGGPSSVAPRSRNPSTGRRRDSPISSSLFLHGPPLCAVG